MLSEEMLKQVAEELAHALIESMPKPEQCQYQFSDKFDHDMQLLLSRLPYDAQKGDCAKKL